MNRESYIIRKITPEDKDSLQALIAGISKESARGRFFSQKNQLTNQELTYLTDVDQENHLALVINENINNSKLIGVARAIKTDSKSNKAELAILVSDEYQRQHLATNLIKDLEVEALNKGIHYFVGNIENSNGKMYLFLKNIFKNNISFNHQTDGNIYFEAKIKN